MFNKLSDKHNLKHNVSCPLCEKHNIGFERQITVSLS